ncbi:MAG TPA: DUF4264 family protein [Clostridiales bacterium]|nr:DUF4264 family protein [Clostridiales bacterium]
MSEKQQTDKLKFIAQKNFKKRDDMYEIVDFLNKSLKEYHLMFGLTNDADDKEKYMIRIYEV